MLKLLIPQRRRDLGGFEVGRVLPFPQQRMVGPFVFFDHMGPVEFQAGMSRKMDVRPHPHIGLSTVTYLFEGEITHRDSVGSEQVIRAGEVNWMTAGRGITHSERFERHRAEGGRMHGIQAWVALPEADEETDPSFAHHGEADLPTWQADGVWSRLVVGDALGQRARVKVSSPMFYLHWQMAPGGRAVLPAEYPERAAYIAQGAVEVDGVAYDAGQMLVFEPGAAIEIKALSPAIVMLIGGEPLGPRYIDWNFVSSRKERIEQAKADWIAQRMKLPDLDNGEFIPLPGNPLAPR